jgi:hypothetical protein
VLHVVGLFIWIDAALHAGYLVNLPILPQRILRAVVVGYRHVQLVVEHGQRSVGTARGAEQRSNRSVAKILLAKRRRTRCVVPATTTSLEIDDAGVVKGRPNKYKTAEVWRTQQSIERPWQAWFEPRQNDVDGGS